MITEFGNVTGGSCECGTVYVCDPTGRNTGEAYMEALALAKGDWQINSISEDVDYETSDMDYDMKTHQRVYSKGRSNAAGRLVFVKLKSPQVESCCPPQCTQAAVPQSGMTTTRAITGGSKMDRKDRLRSLLELRAYDEVADMAMQDKGVIRVLISLTYDKEDVLGWRAIEAIGVVSRTFSKDSEERMGNMRDTIRRLLWSMGEESGGIGWSAAEIVGEIIAGNPDSFNDIVPILWSFRDEEMFRAGIVWAMGRIAMESPGLVGFIVPELTQMLADKKPDVRGYAIWAMGILDGGKGAIGQISGLLDDDGPVPFYKGEDLLIRTVGEIAGEVLHKSPK